MNRNGVILSICILLALLVCWGLFTLSQTTREIRFRITDMGTLGGPSSYVRSLNEKGEAVGSSITAQGVNHAFIWTEEEGMRNLGSFGPEGSSASGVNDFGHVVGNCFYPNHGNESFIWSATNGMVPLSDAMSERCYAFDINNSLQIVGVINYGEEGVESGYWDKSRQWVGLERYGITFARAINERGQIVGDRGDKILRAFLLNTEGTSIDLGTLGNEFSQAIDINELGQVIGLSSSSEGRQVAFIWEEGKMKALETLHPKNHARAFAINSKGQVVGAETPETESLRFWLSRFRRGMWDSSGQLRIDLYRAVLWEEEKVTDLNLLIPDAEDWILEEAMDINDRGQIVGNGVHDGEERAFLLTPIE